jgi:hypothetical protein
MGMYNFNSDFAVKVPADTQEFPRGLPELASVRQSSHSEGGRSKIVGQELESYPYHLEEFLTPGFRALDDAVKQYFSGIRVPTKDNYRFMRVKISGGDKSILIWADDLAEGRVRLPVASISRDSFDSNQDKFSPVYHSMGFRYLNAAGTLAMKYFRPVPFLVKYSMTVWTESKRDAEYVSHQVLTRFHPIAEFRMNDGHLSGNVQLRYDGGSDASDKEMGYDQQANKRYEFGFTAEAWLPLPTKIVPTVRGTVSTISERSGSILATSGSSGLAWSEPMR